MVSSVASSTNDFSDPLADPLATPFANLVGQDQAKTLLNRAVALARIAPGYLFVGPDGTGKALAAAGFTMLLLRSSSDGANDAIRAEADVILSRRIRDRNHPDLLWVEPTYLHQGKLLTVSEAAKTGLNRKGLPRIRLEQIREIARFLARPALESPRAVVVIDQGDRMAEAAANALLKTLEEPGRATIILMAPDQQTLLPTLVSRAQAIPFRRLNLDQMAQVLQKTGYGEILQSPEVMAIAQGSPGRAIISWQQLQQLQTAAPALLAQVDQIGQVPTTRRAALTLARDISQLLDTEAQLWLLDYLQHRYWQQGIGNADTLAGLEKARRYLIAFVQPRLVWEMTLLAQFTQ